jgi:hypothetical protein
VRFAVGNNSRVIVGSAIPLSAVILSGSSKSRPQWQARRSRKFFGRRFLGCGLRLRDLSQGKIEEGLDKLDAFGVIREVEKGDETLRPICDLHIGAIQ